MFNNNIYIIYMDIYREKYLKYKKKYLELQKGGNIITDNGFNQFKSLVDLFNNLNKLLKTNFNFEMNPNRTQLNIPKQLRLSSSNMYYKLSNVRDGNKMVFGETLSLIDRITKNLKYKIKLINSKAVILKVNDNYRLSINLKDEIQIGGAQTYSIEMLIIIITNEERQNGLVSDGAGTGDGVDGDGDGDIAGDFDDGEEIIPPKLSNEELRKQRIRDNRDLNLKINQEKTFLQYHIDNYSLINRELTKSQIKRNKLFLISAHGGVLRNDDIILKPGQRIISLKYFTLYYELPIVVLRFLFPLFREWPAFDKLSFLTQLGSIKIGDQKLDNKFYRKYGIYDGNIEESKTLPNMIFTPLEQRDVRGYLFKEMWNNKNIKENPRIDSNFEEDLTLYHLDGGIMEVPISFTHRLTKKKLDLSKIFDLKKRKINLGELKNHRELFTKNWKLTLNGNSHILRTRYTTPQFYISPHLFRHGITLRNIIDILERNKINEFTIFISSCKELTDIEATNKYRYFDLKEYMESLKEI
jgi:hypothetical protein